MLHNPFKGIGIEFHILQSFPVTCLNRDDVGAPKSAIVGGEQRARVSSQCWKRQVRLTLRDLGLHTAIRTKKLDALLQDACERLGADAAQAATCAKLMADALTTDTLFFISQGEVEALAGFAAEKGFALPVEAKKKKKTASAENAAADESAGTSLPKATVTEMKKCLTCAKTAADGLDIALFGRMVAQAPELNVQAAASFAHAISTHKASNEVEFFTALDDISDMPGSAHMGSLEFNAATYYRYVSLDLGQLWENCRGEDMTLAVGAFVKALYLAVPAARQSTQSGACLWDYAHVLLRRGQRMQVSFEQPVRARGAGWLEPSKTALDAALQQNETRCGSLYGKIAAYTFGSTPEISIDALVSALTETVAQLEQGGAA